MKLIGIDIGKKKHYFCVIDKVSGEIITKAQSFNNNKNGFNVLMNEVTKYSKEEVLIGMEDTGHYHFALLNYLLKRDYKVALMNPLTTNLTRKLQGNITKNDEQDTYTICDVLSTSSRTKNYREANKYSFDNHGQKTATREHHFLKEQINVYTNKLQKCLDIVFPEYNDLFNSKYGRVYYNVLKAMPSADLIASSDIRTIRNCFKIEGKGKRISLTPEKLKAAAKESIGFSTEEDEQQVIHLVQIIQLLEEQIDEIDKKIEEHPTINVSPITSIPGIGSFSGSSILSELGDISNYNNAAQVIKFAGVAPYHYESGQFNAQHTAITKKGSKYLRKTLYQIILPVINHNPVFKEYYKLKISQGKSHRCAQGHCIRKLLRIIFHILSTNQTFDPLLLK